MVIPDNWQLEALEADYLEGFARIVLLPEQKVWECFLVNHKFDTVCEQKIESLSVAINFCESQAAILGWTKQ